MALYAAPVETGPDAHPTSGPMGARSLFCGEKQTGRGVDHPFPPSVEVKESVKLYFYCHYGISWPVMQWTSP